MWQRTFQTPTSKGSVWAARFLLFPMPLNSGVCHEVLAFCSGCSQSGRAGQGFQSSFFRHCLGFLPHPLRPFNGRFKSILVPMLDFLQKIDSFLMLNVYPCYVYRQSNGVVGLDYALFRLLPPTKRQWMPTQCYITLMFLMP